MSEEQLGNASDEQEQGTTEPMVAEAKLRELQSVKDQEIAQQQRAYQAQIRAQEQRLAAMEASLGSMAQSYMEPEDYQRFQQQQNAQRQWSDLRQQAVAGQRAQTIFQAAKDLDVPVDVLAPTLDDPSVNPFLLAMSWKEEQLKKREAEIEQQRKQLEELQGKQERVERRATGADRIGPPPTGKAEKDLTAQFIQEYEELQSYAAKGGRGALEKFANLKAKYGNQGLDPDAVLAQRRRG